MTITRQLMKDVREAVDTILAEIGPKMGVALKLGNGSFLSNEGHFKLLVHPIANGVVESPEKTGWNRWAVAHGFKAEDLGAKFRSGGHEFTIEGVKPSRHRYPIIGKRVSDGKGFKFTIGQVLQGLGRPMLTHDLQDDIDDGPAGLRCW